VSVPGLVGDGEFSIQLLNNRVQPDLRVDYEIPPPERYSNIFKARASLIVERPATILTQIPAKQKIAVVPNPWFGTAARVIEVTPVNLCH